jgi:plasmid stabilization system protein ParE
MAVVLWLPEAFDDLRRLNDFLKSKNPAAAERAAATIRLAADTLTASPAAGRMMGDGGGRRALIVPFGAGAYALRYKIDAARNVVVLRVWHGKEWRE